MARDMARLYFRKGASPQMALPHRRSLRKAHPSAGPKEKKTPVVRQGTWAATQAGFSSQGGLKAGANSVLRFGKGVLPVKAPLPILPNGNMYISVAFQWIPMKQIACDAS